MITVEAIRQWITTTGKVNTTPGGNHGSPHINYGIRVPVMREYVKSILKDSQDGTDSQWIALLDALYAGDTYEERVLPGYLLPRLHSVRRSLELSQLDRWLGQLAGWAEVDNTCQSTFPPAELINRWQEWQPFLKGLSLDENINKRRASLVLLRKSLADNADRRFFDTAIATIERLKHEKPILITKAVSWILRESVKYHRDALEDYLARNHDSLPAIAVRETRNKLDTGKK